MANHTGNARAVPCGIHFLLLHVVLLVAKFGITHNALKLPVVVMPAVRTLIGMKVLTIRLSN